MVNITTVLQQKTKTETIARWNEPFKEILRREDPENPIKYEETENIGCNEISISTNYRRN